MEPFDKSIGCGVVSRGTYLCGAYEAHELLTQVRFDLAATVSGDGRWYTEASNPASEEGVCHGCGRDVRQWDDFRPACKRSTQVNR